MYKTYAIIIIILMTGLGCNNSKKTTVLKNKEKQRIEIKVNPRISDEELNDFVAQHAKELNQSLSENEKAITDELFTILSNLNDGQKYYSSTREYSLVEITKKVNFIIKNLKQDKFDIVEAELKKYFDNHEVNTNGVHVFNNILIDTSYDLTIIKALNRWCKKHPKSSFAFTARGGWYLDEAWRKRGGGYIHTVTQDGFKSFNDCLNLASQDLEYAYKLNNNNYVAATEMITVCMGKSRPYKELIKWFKIATKANPVNNMPYSKLSWAMQARWGGTRKMRTLFEIYVLQNNPYKSRALIGYPGVLESYYKSELKNYESIYSKVAESIYLRYIKDYPNSAYAWKNLADLAWLQNRKKDAIKYLDMGLSRDSVDYVYQKRGEFHYDLDYDQKAFTDFSKATELNPHNYKSWNKLGNLYQFWKKDYEQAIKCYSKTLQYKPTYKITRRRMADCYRELQNFDRAMDEYNKVLKRSPEYEWALLGRGTLYWQMKKYNLATKDFEKVIEIDPKMVKNVNEVKNKYK